MQCGMETMGSGHTDVAGRDTGSSSRGLCKMGDRGRDAGSADVGVQETGVRIPLALCLQSKLRRDRDIKTIQTITHCYCPA